MSSSFIVCEINRVTGEIKLNGASHVLRPKTHELLMLLAQSPHQVFSKSQILTQVWQDSVIEEQVVFQSINEIRKALGQADVITTYPKRGYKWNVERTQFIDPLSISVQKNKYALKLVAVLFTVLLAITIVYVASMSSSNSTIETDVKEHKGILVLPFQINDSLQDMQWLRFGAMEGLISLISPNQQATVFHLEDVIDILNRVAIGERKNIDKIFQRSGTSHILETSIGGQLGELNIVYTLYTRHKHITQVLHAKDINSALPKLAKLFNHMQSMTAAPLKQVNLQLQNELLANAMRFLESGDSDSALSFIESALLNQPNNILALYFSARINMELGNANEAMLSVDKALLELSENHLDGYKHRLQYLKAAALLSLGNIQEAENNLIQAQVLAKGSFDWLYYGYTHSILGLIRQHQLRFEQANQHFNLALQYQQILKCPMGIAQGYLDLAGLLFTQQKRQLGQEYLYAASKLIEEKQLTKVLPLLKQVEKQSQDVSLR
ncbi:hypothetical protein PSECIP111951_02134 [Pseudoalteromonas holothuriae]|uniref:OmpR/PhoB-type domain-containing protein n=1 Tax=Pseudoalteromonas holothuriae TaxID=2963714 RepID=A0ABM9GJ01_9GAMM|nr:winged helix-turn-helix domain-containing protein [Pseudoalteromonas sp. CIP111951]CAH9059754.1 hypothetical protein PSECIP111951_02134 [Pseudoalteromonas sp. CIP111951]